MPPKFASLTMTRMSPSVARNWLKAIRHLMQYAASVGMVSADPTQGLKLPKLKTDGVHTWSENEIAVFESAHPIGTKARLAFGLLLHTAQRRSDVIRMGR